MKYSGIRFTTQAEEKSPAFKQKLIVTLRYACLTAVVLLGLVSIIGTGGSGGGGGDGNQPPEANISSPFDGSVYNFGDMILFRGFATDPEGGALPPSGFSWRSSLDGLIEAGVREFSTDLLSEGTHTITLTVTDSDGDFGIDSITLTVNDPINRINHPPEANITSPTDGSVYNVGEMILFRGVATDPEDGALPPSGFSWRSSLDGLIEAGVREFSTYLLSEGTHTITLTVTDSEGGTAESTITVINNFSPTALITNPVDGRSFYTGATVLFDGTGEDPEDGELTGNSLVWESDKDGRIGTGASFSTATLAEGSHIITLTATDSNGASGTDSVGINIVVLESLTNSLGMTFNLLPAGTFTMGSPSDEPGRWDREGPQHEVTLTQAFYMQTTEVTQGQWQSVMGSNPSWFSGCDECPVEDVSWNDIQSFITALNALGEGTYRLPTEAEWEYAARAGSTTAFANGPITETGSGYDPVLNSTGWYMYNSSSRTHPVALKDPNAWGLYDMHGNVWEWVADWDGSYPSGSVTDPTGPESGISRVLRGGSWYDFARVCRSAYRSGSNPDNRGINYGFRLVLLPGH